MRDTAPQNARENCADIYRQLCITEHSIPIFSRAWWLDATAGPDGWEVITIEKNGVIVAAMPYVEKRRLFFKYLVQPQLTQTLGPWFRKQNLDYSKELTSQKKMMSELVSKIPRHDHFSQNWHYSITNWLPFYWERYSQTTRYTYVIEDIKNLNGVVKNFDYSKRKNIQKSEKVVHVAYDISSDVFYDNHKMTLEKQGKKISYSREYFKGIYDAGIKESSAVVIGAYDCRKNLHAALFVVWDEDSAYNLISTIDPEFRNSGAASLLVKEAISFVQGKTNKFDFEGSMIESIEHSFRQFGAKQVPYFNISRTPSRLIKTFRFLRELWNG